MIADKITVLNQIGLSDWVNPWDAEHIIGLVSKLSKGDIYLEIGVAHGASLALAAESAKEGVKVFGVDVIDWSDRNELIRKYLEIFGKEPKHAFFNDDSRFLAKKWQEGNIDVLYIDGDHTYLGVLKDMVSWLPWVKHGGWILFDDYNDKTGVKEAVNELLLHHKAFKNFTIDNEMFLCQKI